MRAQINGVVKVCRSAIEARTPLPYALSLTGPHFVLDYSVTVADILPPPALPPPREVLAPFQLTSQLP